MWRGVYQSSRLLASRKGVGALAGGRPADLTGGAFGLYWGEMTGLLRCFAFFLLTVGAPAETVRVLFIGNSYTFYNDLPAMLAALGEKRGVRFENTVNATGSASLASHWQGGSGKELETGRYDYVVLQDQSIIPSIHPEMTIRFGGEFCRAAQANHCRPVFLLTWGRLATSKNKMVFDSAMQRQLTTAYSRAAVEGHALVAPAGEAWRLAYASIPGCRLHLDDGSHPNAYGTYLSACVLFRTLAGRTALGLPGTLTDNSGGRRRLLCRLSPERARLLQQCAEKAALAFSPERYLAREREREATLPARSGVVAQMRKGMAAKELDQLAGPPVLKDRETRTRQYRLRDGIELSAVFDSRDRLLRASLYSPADGKVEILDWKKTVSEKKEN